MDQEALVRKVRTATELGSAIRAARRVKGIDQAELATLCQVGRMTISRLERGQDVAASTALRALSECGYALVVAPKAVKLTIGQVDDG